MDVKHHIYILSQWLFNVLFRKKAGLATMLTLKILKKGLSGIIAKEFQILKADLASYTHNCSYLN